MGSGLKRHSLYGDEVLFSPVLTLPISWIFQNSLPFFILSIFIHLLAFSIPSHWYHVTHTGTPLFKNSHDQICKLKQYWNIFCQIGKVFLFFMLILNVVKFPGKWVLSYTAGKDINRSTFQEGNSNFILCLKNMHISWAGSYTLGVYAKSI